MFTSIAVTPVNHILRGESWACKRLQAYAGKTARIQMLPFPDVIFTIQADGILSEASDGATVDTTISFTPELLPHLLLKNTDLVSKIKIIGENAVAKELLDIGMNIHWDAEQDLSNVIGDIPAHRIVQTSENLMHWHTESIFKLSQTLAEYWTEEQPMLANAAFVNDFTREVNVLHDDTELLEQRIQKTINKVPHYKEHSPTE